MALIKQVVGVAVLLFCFETLTQAIELKNQVITSYSTDLKNAGFFSVQALPEIRQGWNIGIDGQIAFDVSAKAVLGNDGITLDPYRLTARYAKPQWMLRLGLQKIVFGPSKILRTLQWFDTLNPADPVGLSDGVYGVLGRYYFLNNSTFSVWGLSGNEELRGLDSVKSEPTAIEMGGRYQFPFASGELGFTTHKRRLVTHSTSEYRTAVDLNLDLGVGFWTEFGINFERTSSRFKMSQQNATFGLDYTFDSTYVLTETLISNATNRPTGVAALQPLSALRISQTLGLIDRFDILLTQAWATKQTGKVFSYQMVFDTWSLAVSYLNLPSVDKLVNDDRVQVLLTHNW